MADFKYTMIENVDKKAVDAELAKAYQEFMDDFEAGTVDKMTLDYADDAIFLHGVHNRVFQGSQAVTGAYMDLAKKYKDWSFKPDHRTYLKNAVAEIGTFSITRKDNGEVKKAKYCSLIVKKDGRWVCQYDFIGNDEQKLFKAAGKPDKDPIEAINYLYERFMLGFEQRDIEAVLACYTDDCRFVLGGSNILIKGRSSLRKAYMDLFRKYKSLKIEPNDQTIGHEDFVTEMGSYTLTQRHSDLVKEGMYMSMVVKKRGNWLYKYHMLGVED